MLNIATAFQVRKLELWSYLAVRSFHHCSVCCVHGMHFQWSTFSNRLDNKRLLVFFPDWIVLGFYSLAVHSIRLTKYRAFRTLQNLFSSQEKKMCCETSPPSLLTVCCRPCYILAVCCRPCDILASVCLCNNCYNNSILESLPKLLKSLPFVVQTISLMFVKKCL